MRNIVSQILNAREVRADVVTTNSINGVSSEEHARVKGVKYPIQGQIDSLWKKKNDLKSLLSSATASENDVLNGKNVLRGYCKKDRNYG